MLRNQFQVLGRRGDVVPGAVGEIDDRLAAAALDANDTVNVPDCGCDTTVAVCAEVADDDPAEFDAVTTTCNFDPTSAADNKYDA